MDIFLLFQLIYLLYYASTFASCSQPTIGNPNDVDWTSITDSRGNQLPDFSFCGYHNSDIPIPTINQRDVTVSLQRTISDDFSPMIQAAIDSVSASGGGVVQLPSGRINITAGIQLHSNVILTGTGNHATTLALNKQPSKPVFTLGTPSQTTPTPRAISKITNTYVPVGSFTIQVASTTGLRVGQDVYISRVVTEPWVRYNGMSNLFRYGLRQQWIPIGKRIMSPNKIQAINGNTITLKIPITDNLDATYMAPELRAYTLPEQSTEIGIQNLRIEVPNTCSGRQLVDTTCNNAAIEISPWTADCWVSNLMLVGFNRFIDVIRHASRITIQDVIMNRNKDIFGALSL
ncbi:hypothetical protein NXS19_008200 [Fusarium pseudograminearum]|nr:hypothetical protein NXS19_008200 [Fusarium pseudograminearum]